MQGVCVCVCDGGWQISWWFSSGCRLASVEIIRTVDFPVNNTDTQFSPEEPAEARHVRVWDDTHTHSGRSSVLETPYGVTGDLLSLCRLFLSSFLFFYLLTIVLCFDSQYMSCKCEELVWRRCVTPFTLSHTDCRWFDGMGSEGHADAIIPH